MKKRQKQRQVEAKRAEKAAAAPAKGQKRGNAEDAEKDLTPNQYFEIRSRAVNKLRETHQPNPYPHKFHVNTDLRDFLERYKDLKTGELRQDVEVRIGARIYTKRASGSNLRFYDVRAEGARVQVMCQSQESTSDVPFVEQHEHLQRGDIVGIKGYPGRTNPKTRAEGELSIFAQEIILLSPCLHQLPTEHYGFKDQEQRFRRRHLDLIMNDQSRNTLITRSKIVKYVRRYDTFLHRSIFSDFDHAEL